jgi:hypothetical protein
MLQADMQRLFEKIRDDTDAAFAISEKLDARAAQADAAIAGLKAQLAATNAYAADMDARAAALTAFLEANEADDGSAMARPAASVAGAGPSAIAAARAGVASLGLAAAAGAADGGVAGGDASDAASSASGTPRRAGGASAEELVVAASRLEAQVLDAVAEDAAVEDTLLVIDEALSAGAIHMDAMLREVRELAKRQLRARALARKVDAALAEDAARRGGAASGAGGGMPAARVSLSGGLGQPAPSAGHMAAALLRPMPGLQQQGPGGGGGGAVPMGTAYPSLAAAGGAGSGRRM